MLKRSVVLVLITCLMLCFTGCNKVRITAGLTGNQFARIDGTVVSMDMAELMLSEYKYSYEKLFDSQVWDKEMNASTTEEYVKNKVRDTVKNIIFAANLSDELRIELTENEQNKIKDAAQDYMDSLNAEARSSISKEAVEEFYYQLLLAEKGFYGITDSVDTKVSTDEARRIYVQYIFFGRDKKTADIAYRRASYGEDFLMLAAEYNKDAKNSLELGQGEYDRDFEKAAFKLDSGEVSPVVETEYGYYIIKCINYNLESDYEKQCEMVILARRRDLYTEQYLLNSNNKKLEFNDKFWEDTDISELNSGSGELYNIYNEYFY